MAITQNEKMILAYPLRYMNISGPALIPLIKRYEGKAHWLVAHDELDLSCGQIRLKEGGSAGGHNGLRSLGQTSLGLNFLRLKIGISRPENKVDVSDYVLSAFSSVQRALIAKAFAHALHSLPLLFDHQKEAFIRNTLSPFV